MNRPKCKLIEKKCFKTKLINKFKLNFNVFSKIITNKFFNNKNGKINEQKEDRNKYGFPISK